MFSDTPNYAADRGICSGLTAQSLRGVKQCQQKAFFSFKKHLFCADSSYLHIAPYWSATSGSGATVRTGRPAPGSQLFHFHPEELK